MVVLSICDVYILVHCCGVYQGNEKDAAVEQKDENEPQVSTQESKDATCKEDVSSTSVFVNTRRGKGNGTKRKISETAMVTECNELPPTAEEV